MDQPDNGEREERLPIRSKDLLRLLSSKVVGQTHALEFIVPSIQMHQSGLAPEGRPVGIFLLLGPTGTGKTKTVEALAEVLHGDSNRVVRVDCGEFQSEHEVSKLIGAPPGYVGHTETEPVITQKTLDQARSEDCDLALVLFDEIEKAAVSLAQLLLGVLDKGVLRLGDGSTVSFEGSIIFLTSNLGARDMMTEIQPTLGFDTAPRRAGGDLAEHLERVGLRAVQKHFSPEFVNRVDGVITYRPLDASSLVAILDQHVFELQQHVYNRLGNRSFQIEIEPAARYFMLDKGTSMEYGARELKRTIHRFLTQPLAAMVANGEIEPGAQVTVNLGEEGESLTLVAEGGHPLPVQQTGSVLAVDDNGTLLAWMDRVLTEEGFDVAVAASMSEALEKVGATVPNLVILDYLLPDGDGVSLAVELLKQYPSMRAVIMSGATLEEEDTLLCQRYDIPVLIKPFVADELFGALEAISLKSPATKSAGT